jgi:hypothetical protein
LIFVAMQERQAKEAGTIYALDDVVTDVKLVVQTDKVLVQYQDGTRMEANALGIAVITKEDNDKAADRLKKANPKDTDFPVVVFFNTSGFDATGDVRMVRRAKDGGLVWQAQPVTVPIKAVIPQRNGSFRVIDTHIGDAAPSVVTEEDFHRQYLGLDTLKLPPAEELAKMTAAELDKLGLVRMSKEEYDKKYAKESVKETAKVPAIPPPAGVKGIVFQVGGSAVTPLVVPLYVLTGKVTPRSKIDPADKDLITTVTTDKAGAFSIPLPPGEYTLVVLVDGSLRGNALNQQQWPSVKVGQDKWKDYEFRVTK